MAWTTPRTWATSELVTASIMNTHVRDNLTFLSTITEANDLANTRTFTNTGFLDLDALTGGSGTLAACAVSVVTGTRALVHMCAASVSNSGTGTTALGYRISGATTVAASSTLALRVSGVAAVLVGATRTHLVTGLNAGTNVFELQALVSANTGTLTAPQIIVEPLPT